MAKKLWILTEERPKKDVLQIIIEEFKSLENIDLTIQDLKITPILDTSGDFTFEYELIGFSSDQVSQIKLAIISGKSSFVDFLVYYQEKKPVPSDKPSMAIEETKTDDSESRNTGVFQRATKFVYANVFYPNVPLKMLYRIQIEEKSAPKDTNIFGTRCLRTLEVDIIGKRSHGPSDRPWTSIDEMIKFKNQMRKPPKGNVPINIRKTESLITISGRLFKAGSLSHDPNIGSLSLISATLRKLGWEGRIQIIQHGLEQHHITAKNKFIQIANHLNLELAGLHMPEAEWPHGYWYYNLNGEKNGSIFLHLLIDDFTDANVIYENHAGCERGYFYTKEQTPLTVSKRIQNSDGSMPKSNEVIRIPDLVIRDSAKKEIYIIEGEMAKNMQKGIQQLDTFTNFENHYVKKYYPEENVFRSVILFGGNSASIEHSSVSLLLNQFGNILLDKHSPQLFRDALLALERLERFP